MEYYNCSLQLAKTWKTVYLFEVRDYITRLHSVQVTHKIFHVDFCLFRYNTLTYYMASSASGQDEPNRAMWLATRAGKMEPSCPLGTTRCIPQEKLHRKPYNKSFIDQVCILASFFFCEFMDLDFVSVHKHAKKELGQYPAILTSHLVNNPYILAKTWQIFSVTFENEPWFYTSRALRACYAQ